MTVRLTPDLREILVQFARRRIECIRTGDRPGLDATYSPGCLNRRNQYNGHDYHWYLDLIERGFGEDPARIDIHVVEIPSDLPFAGMVTYPWPPEFKAFVQTVSGRRTLWLIRLFEDGPRVVLPAFDGRVADRVATGVWQLPCPAPPEESATVQEFHPHHFTVAVAESVALSLYNWSFRLKFETLRAAALCCAPWYGGCCIAVLTTREDFPEDEHGKWATGEWRWSEMEELGPELCHLIRAYYEGKTVTDPDRTPAQRAEVIFRCLAQALKSPEVATALKRFDLTADFEVGVFNPDSSREGNYCIGSQD